MKMCIYNVNRACFNILKSVQSAYFTSHESLQEPQSEKKKQELRISLKRFTIMRIFCVKFNLKTKILYQLKQKSMAFYISTSTRTPKRSSLLTFNIIIH